MGRPVGDFIMTPNFWTAASDDDRRSAAEIAVAELVGCVLANPDLLDDNDPALSFARLIGLDRLTSSTRERLEEALMRAPGLLAN